MSFKKTIFILSFLFSFSPIFSSAQTNPNQAVFTSISGKVTVTQGKKSRTALKSSTAAVGETVITGKDSTATLRFFDGSELNVKPETQFTIAKLEKSGLLDKILQFKLSFGKLFAAVKKLASSKSSFEIEAGGVVCGVRGTQYEVDYDPAHNRVDILVTEGNVWAKTGGGTYEYGPGSQGHFTDGKPGPDNGNSEKGGKGKGLQPPGPPTASDQGNQPPGPPDNFSPFYGLNGNQQDPFQPLTGMPGDTRSLSDQASNDSLLGIGAHTVILQLKYPEQ